jgi:non-canonical (house-cleaning) NTP pyrophosphatase
MSGEEAPKDRPKATLRIAVGSLNPSKLRAVKQAMTQILEHKESPEEVSIHIVGFDVESGVPDQPMGDEETCRGAQNRAVAAFAAYKKAQGERPHFAIGLEGGLEEISLPTTPSKFSTAQETTSQKMLYCMAWMAVYGKRSAFTVDLLASQESTAYYGDRKPVFGCAKTGTFAIPPKVGDLVKEGMELGYANDQAFQTRQSKHGLGAVGILTDGLIDRSAYYQHALLLALTPWIRPDVYPSS